MRKSTAAAGAALFFALAPRRRGSVAFRLTGRARVGRKRPSSDRKIFPAEASWGAVPAGFRVQDGCGHAHFRTRRDAVRPEILRRSSRVTA
jgi:hypothetical protein